MDTVKLPKYLQPKYSFKKIRVGKKYDGGYVAPLLAIKKSESLISFGMYDDWSFEKHFSKLNKKINIFVYDGSVNFFFWIKYYIKNFILLIRLKIELNNFIKSFFKIFDYYIFFNKKKILHIEKFVTSADKKISNINKKITLNQIFNNTPIKNVFLKIDIEGNEYRILNDILKYKNKIECMVIEFHNFDLMQKKIKNFLKKFNLCIVHTHVNNYGRITQKETPTVIELTLSKKSYCKSKINKNFKLPILNLDFPNNPKTPDFKIKFI